MQQACCCCCPVVVPLAAPIQVGVPLAAPIQVASPGGSAGAAAAAVAFPAVVAVAGISLPMQMLLLGLRPPMPCSPTWSRGQRQQRPRLLHLQLQRQTACVSFAQAVLWPSCTGIAQSARRSWAGVCSSRATSCTSRTCWSTPCWQTYTRCSPNSSYAQGQGADVEFVEFGFFFLTFVSFPF